MDDFGPLLSSPHEDDRRRAALELAREPDAGRIAALINLAESDPSVEVRYFARRALHAAKESLPRALAGGPPAPATLEEVRRDLAAADPAQRAAAARAAAAAGYREALPLILEALERESDPTVLPALLVAAGAFGGEPEIGRLASFLAHPSPRARATAIEALELVGSPLVYAHIVPALADPDNRVRANAVRAVERLNHVSKAKVLAAMAGSGVAAMQASAAHGLRHFPTPEHARLVAALAGAPDAAVRANARRTLALFRDAGVEGAAELLAAAPPEAGQGEAGLDALDLELSAFSREREELRAGLASAEPAARIAAVERAMDAGGAGIGPILLDQLGREGDPTCLAHLAISLGRLEHDPALPALAPLLSHPEPRVRANAVEALKLMNRPEALEAVTPLLRDTHNRVRANAVLALAGRPGFDTCAAVEGMIATGEEPMQRSALYVIAELGDPALHPLVASLARSPHAEVSRQARELADELRRAGAKDLGERPGRLVTLYLLAPPFEFDRVRERLHARHFPALARRAAESGFLLHVVDPWRGLDPERAAGPAWRRLRLREIERAAAASPDLCVLALLGERAGPVEPPERIPAREFEKLKRGLRRAIGRGEFPPRALDRLREAYAADANAAPPMMRLAAPDEGLPAAARDALARLLGAAAEALPQPRRARYRRSAFEEEFEEAVGRLAHAGRSVVALARTVRNAAALRDRIGARAAAAEREAFGRFFDLTPDGHPDEAAAARAAALRARAAAALGDALVTAEAGWRADGPDPAAEEAAADAVAEALARRLDELVARAAARGEAADETLHHLGRAENEADRFAARVRERAAAEAYASFAEAGVIDPGAPLLVVGAPGSGKSALIARAFATARRELAARSPGARLAIRFLGATPASSAPAPLVSSLLAEFGRDPASGVAGLRTLLAGDDAPRPLLLALDGLDHLPAGEPLDWLPARLPANVRLLLSARSGTPAEAAARALLAEAGKAGNTLDLAPLGRADLGALLDAFMEADGRRLTPALRARTLELAETDGRPLWLELARFALAASGHAADAESCDLSGTPEALAEDTLERLALAERHGEPLISAALSAIAASAEGLAAPELSALLAGDPAALAGLPRRVPLARGFRGLPDLAFARLVSDLAPLLAERFVDGLPLLSFRHPLLADACRRHYLVEDHLPAARARLAAHFAGGPERAAADGGPVLRARALTERARALAALGDARALERLLLDPDWGEAKARAGRITELADEFAALERVAPKSPAGELARLLRRSVEADAAALALRPGPLLPHLWNRGFLRDAPEAARHHARGGGWFAFLAADRPPWKRRGPKLSDLLLGWRERHRASGGGPWLRALRPARPTLDEPLRSASVPHRGILLAVAFSPDGRRLATGSEDGLALVHPLRGGSPVRLAGHLGPVAGVAFSPDGRRLATGSWDRHVRLFDAGSGALLWAAGGHENYVTAVAFSPGGDLVASASADGAVRLFDAATGGRRAVLRGHDDLVRCVAFSPDGALVASGAKDRRVILFDVKLMRETLRLEGHGDLVSSLAFLPGGRLATGSWDRAARIFDLATGRETRRLEGPAHLVSSVAASPDGRTLAAASEDRGIHLFDVETGRVRMRLEGHHYGVEAVAFSPCGGLLASGGKDRALRIWDARPSPPAPLPVGHAGVVHALAYSGDGRRLASGGHDGALRLWDARSGEPLAEFGALGGPVRAAALSRDGALALTGSDDRRALLLRAKGGPPLLALEHPDAVTAVALSADGALLATGTGGAGEDRAARVFSAKDGAPVAALRGHHGGALLALAFSPGGDRLATGSADGFVRLFAVRGGQFLAAARCGGAVEEIAFRPDGAFVAASSDGSTRVFSAEGACLDARPGRFAASPLALGSLLAARLAADGVELARTSDGRAVAFHPARPGAFAGAPDGRGAAYADEATGHVQLLALEDD